MADKKVNLIISLKDGVSSGLSKIRKGLGHIGSAFKTVTKIGAVAFVGLGAAASALAVTIKKAFLFETLTTRIKVFVGSLGEAEKAFKDLKEFSASTPFELPGIVNAFLQLKNFTGEALSGRKGLELVGDAAAATANDFADTAFWTAKLYSALKNDAPFMDAIGALERMGIVGGEVRGKLTDLTTSGADLGTMWGVVEESLKKFEGGMKELSLTGGGLISTLKDNWTIALATFGQAFTDAAKGGITDLIDTIKRLVSDGTITEWAEQAKAGLQAVIDTIKIISGGGEGSKKVLGAVADVIKAAFSDAVSKAIELLVKAAPTVGKLIFDGFNAGTIALLKAPVIKNQIRGELESAGKLEPVSNKGWFWGTLSGMLGPGSNKGWLRGMLPMSKEEKLADRERVARNNAIVDLEYNKFIEREQSQKTNAALDGLGVGASETEKKIAVLGEVIKEFSDSVETPPPASKPAREPVSNTTSGGGEDSEDTDGGGGKSPEKRDTSGFASLARQLIADPNTSSSEAERILREGIREGKKYGSEGATEAERAKGRQVEAEYIRRRAEGESRTSIRRSLKEGEEIAGKLAGEFGEDVGGGGSGTDPLGGGVLDVGGGGSGTGPLGGGVLDEDITSPKDAMTTAIKTAITDIYAEAWEVKSESISTLMAEQKEILANIYALQLDRLGGVKTKGE